MAVRTIACPQVRAHISSYSKIFISNATSIPQLLNRANMARLLRSDMLNRCQDLKCNQVEHISLREMEHGVYIMQRRSSGVFVYYCTSSRNGANPRPGISRGRAHPLVTTPMPRDKCSSASFTRFSETAARICSCRCEGRASDRISKVAHVGAIAWLVRLPQVLSLGHERFPGATRSFNGLSTRPVLRVNLFRWSSPSAALLPIIFRKTSKHLQKHT